MKICHSLILLTSIFCHSQQIYEYNLNFGDSFTRQDAFEHTHFVTTLAGLLNRQSPVLYTPYISVDLMWKHHLIQKGQWLENASFIEINATLPDLITIFRDRIKGIVLYDPAVAATSNIASTIAGVENLLPVAYWPNIPNSIYNQVVQDQKIKLPVLVNLVGQFTGIRTGSAKCDAYLWAKEKYLDTGRTNPSKMAYYVDYFGATLQPQQIPPVPPAQHPKGKDHLNAGEFLVQGERLVSSNGEFHLEIQNDGNLVLYAGWQPQQTARVLWETHTSDKGGFFFLTMQTDGNLVLYKGKPGSSEDILWSSNTAKAGGNQFWLWMQHDANLVLYKGIFANGEVIWASNTVEVPNYSLTKISNHDYFIANRAFFFDLSLWDDEVPNDDPKQPLGTDRGTLLAILESAYNQTMGTAMIHVGGFTPWSFKYTHDGSCKICKHGGVETEWETMKVFSAFNIFDDGDACCIGAMANSQFFSHFPLPERLIQPNSPPTKSSLQQRGLIDEDGKVKPKSYGAFYAGDYDSAAWLYHELKNKWDDNERGLTPIGWAIDSELSMRFPIIYPYLYATASKNDVFISGDSGAGYLNPTQLFPPRAISNINKSAESLWIKWNQKYYQRFDLSFTGFVINGAAGTMTPEAEAMYQSFSPDGIVISTNHDPIHNAHFAVNTTMPVLHHATDLPKDIKSAAKLVAKFAAQQREHPTKPQFLIYRTILKTASYHHQVAEQAKNITSNLEWVDPVTMGVLAKLYLGGNETFNYNRVKYLNDTIPHVTTIGASHSVSFCLYNIGWNTLSSNFKNQTDERMIHRLYGSKKRKMNVTDEMNIKSSSQPVHLAYTIIETKNNDDRTSDISQRQFWIGSAPIVPALQPDTKGCFSTDAFIAPEKPGKYKIQYGLQFIDQYSTELVLPFFVNAHMWTKTLVVLRSSLPN